MFADLGDDNKDDDFLDEFRQKLGNQSMENFEEKKNEINRSKNVFIGAVSGIALAAVVGWFVLAPRYADNTSTELPVIRRPQSAIKVQPAEPGGMEILNQDKSVYDIIEKKDNTAPIVENLLPPPEEPQLPVIAAAPAASVAPSTEPDSRVVDKVIAEQQPSSTEQKAAEIIRVAETPVAATVTNVEPEAQPTTLSQAAATTPAVEEKIEEAKVVEKVTIPAVLPASVFKENPATAGSWQVQMMSSPNKKAVESAWPGLIKKYDMLKGLPYEIETADLGAKGTFYRLKAGAFADRSGADRLCNDFKAMGGTCIVKRK